MVDEARRAGPRQMIARHDASRPWPKGKEPVMSRCANSCLPRSCSRRRCFRFPRARSPRRQRRPGRRPNRAVSTKCMCALPTSRLPEGHRRSRAGRVPQRMAEGASTDAGPVALARARRTSRTSRTTPPPAFTASSSHAFKARGYDIVTAPGPGVLRVSPRGDRALRQRARRGVGTGTPLQRDCGGGDADLEAARFRDGTLLARVVDRGTARELSTRINPAFAVTNVFWFDAMFRQWTATSIGEFDAKHAAR